MSNGLTRERTKIYEGAADSFMHVTLQSCPTGQWNTLTRGRDRVAPGNRWPHDRSAAKGMRVCGNEGYERAGSACPQVE